jgi:hypothetical protein
LHKLHLDAINKLGTQVLMVSPVSSSYPIQTPSWSCKNSCISFLAPNKFFNPGHVVIPAFTNTKSFLNSISDNQILKFLLPNEFTFYPPNYNRNPYKILNSVLPISYNIGHQAEVVNENGTLISLN